MGDAYDVVASTYATLLPDCSFEASLDLAMVRHFVKLLPGTAVLDAGCGSGRMMRHLKSIDRDLRIDGVDLSSEMVRLARAVHPESHVTQGELALLPFPDEQFDGVLSWYSIIHSPPTDFPKVFSEMSRVVRIGGVVLAAFQAGEGEEREIIGAYGHDVTMTAWLHSAPAVVESMRAEGLDPVTTLTRGPRAEDRYPQAFVMGLRTR